MQAHVAFKDASVANAAFKSLAAESSCRDTNGRAQKTAKLTSGTCEGQIMSVVRLVAHNGAAVHARARDLKKKAAQPAAPDGDHMKQPVAKKRKRERAPIAKAVKQSSPVPKKVASA